MTAPGLVNLLLEYVQRIHPTFDREHQFIWIAGVLADTVLEKNHMDNVVLAKLQARMQRLEQAK